MEFVFVIICLDRTKSVNTATPHLQRLSTVLMFSNTREIERRKAAVGLDLLRVDHGLLKLKSAPRGCAKFRVLSGNAKPKIESGW